MAPGTRSVAAAEAAGTQALINPPALPQASPGSNLSAPSRAPPGSLNIQQDTLHDPHLSLTREQLNSRFNLEQRKVELELRKAEADLAAINARTV